MAPISAGFIEKEPSPFLIAFLKISAWIRHFLTNFRRHNHFTLTVGSTYKFRGFAFRQCGVLFG